MPQPIVVGFDGSEHSRSALFLARAMAAEFGTRLIVVNAYTPQKRWWSPGTAQAAGEQELERIVAAAEAEFSEHDQYEVRLVASPSAAGALHATAESEGAQLIIVGRTHLGTVDRVLLGTVTQAVLDAAPCPVLVAPTKPAASTERIPLRRIGVGFDATPEAHEALAFAHLLAERVGASLNIVWAAHLAQQALPLSLVGYLDPSYFEEVRADVEGRLQQAADSVRDGLSIRTEIASGNTVAAFVDRSERLDLLVLGSRGYGPLQRVLLGSVSRAVVSQAHCPVLVVGRGMRTLGSGAVLSTAGESSIVSAQGAG